MSESDKQTTYFGQIANIYDNQQPVLIRQYSEIHSLVVQMLQLERQTPFSAVDLGCGTGTLARMILETYPFVDVTCMDVSPEMISIAQGKLSEFAGRTEFIVADLAEPVFQKQYDAAVSIHAIHHLPNSGKRDLFGRLYSALKPNGMLLLADTIAIESMTLKEKNSKLVKERIQRLIRDGKLSRDEIDQRRRIKKIAEQQGIEKDYLCTFSELNGALEDAGFEEVECFWRYFDDVIIIACMEKREIITESEWLEIDE